jgi:hypothetical protein
MAKTTFILCVLYVYVAFMILMEYYGFHVVCCMNDQNDPILHLLQVPPASYGALQKYLNNKHLPADCKHVIYFAGWNGVSITTYRFHKFRCSASSQTYQWGHNFTTKSQVFSSGSSMLHTILHTVHCLPDFMHYHSSMQW